MPATGPVSLTRQTIYAVLPVLDLIAFYKIKCLRKYMLIVYVGVAGVASSAYSLIVTPDSWSFSTNYDSNWIFDTTYWILQLPMLAITITIQIYLVRRWSKRWNDQFHNY